MTALDDDACDEPTPWFEPPEETHGTSEVVAPHDLCVVVFSIMKPRCLLNLE